VQDITELPVGLVELSASEGGLGVQLRPVGEEDPLRATEPVKPVLAVAVTVIEPVLVGLKAWAEDLRRG